LILRKIIKIAAARCHFKAKMHQIRFRLGLCPRLRWGSLQCSPDPLAGFKGPTSEGRRGGQGRAGERGGELRDRGRGGSGRRMGIAHPLFSA